MKTLVTIFCLFGILGMSPAFGQDLSGEITLRDGGNILRINVGDENDRSSHSMAKRIRRLEKAVRGLQNRVYELEDDSKPRRRTITMHTCILPTTFHGIFIGKGSTKAEARANAVNACRKGDSFPCKDNEIKSCETSTEYENY